MTPERWKIVGELFHRSLEQPREERMKWVESACAGDAELRAEVLSLLGSDAVAGEGFIEKKIQPAVTFLLHGTGPPAIPKRLGPYRLVHELGRGGMGTVYLAERDDDEYQAQVAIKIVRRGMDTDLILSRFYRERQTLARLQHPNIARLLDGGTVEGCPYIVMEFVDGERITTYCRDRNLSVARRLALFRDVCKAVSYAHRHFVVHRDIKPGNILVDKGGEVKLLDFGICKLLQTQPQTSGVERDQTAEVGLAALTPDYASPEQIRGDPITVASDIYSLGAVLYELLTGVKAHRIEDYSLRGMERSICETAVVRPSVACPEKSIARQLKGDLDNILACTLDKDPLRRYESVDQFADDIQRHLDYEPVKARLGSVGYRMGKFVHRRKGFVAAASLVAVTLLLGVLASMRSAQTAQENLRMVRQLSNTFLFDVHDAVRDLPGATHSRKLIVETGLRYLANLSRRAAGDADFEQEIASAYRRVGDLQGDVMNANLGSTEDALASYQKALTLLDSALKKDPQHRLAISEQITVHRRIGNIQDSRREPEKAMASFRKAERLAESVLARMPEDHLIALQLAEVFIASSNSLRRATDWANTRKGYAKAVELLKRLDQARPGDWETRLSLAAAHAGVGLADVRMSKFEDALRSYRQAAEIRESLMKSDPSNVITRRELMIMYSQMGDLLGNPNLTNMGDTKGARQAFARMLELAKRIHEDDPADQRARSDYAIALARMAAVLPSEEAPLRVKMLTQTIQLQKEVARVNPGNLSNRSEMAMNCRFLGDAYLGVHDPQNAIRTYREGLELAESITPSMAPALARATSMMYRKAGELLAQSGDRRGALAMGERALQMVKPDGPAAKGWPADTREILGARGAVAMGQILAALANSAQRQGSDRREARQWLEKGLHLFRVVQGKPLISAQLPREVQAVERELEKLR